MKTEEIAQKYFYPGTRGYNILRRYYVKYQDLFIKTLFSEFDEFLNQVLVSVSSINFSDEIKNIEAYIIGTIKIQCRVQLDKSIKEKNKINLNLLTTEDENEDEIITSTSLKSPNPDPAEEVHSQEVFNAVNRFKLTIREPELIVLNSLIDEIPRKELSEKMQINLNTLDTQIRRLRIKFQTYMENEGHSLASFKRFNK